jgi:threonine 3-dehydrogenase
MKALIFDTSKEQWESSRGFTKADVPEPTLDEAKIESDKRAVIIKVRYAGLCGTDRGIWNRQAFRDQILGSLEKEGKSARVIGHEFCGDVVGAGSEVKEAFGITSGDFVSCESHVVCNDCFQCRAGEKHVCTNEKILGISHDGCYAEYIKVPGHIVWKTDSAKIRSEIAAMQEPFGNAVHAVSKTDVRGKNVAIFGLGPIGLFALLVARGLGAKKIIGVDPNPKALSMAKQMGIDETILLESTKESANPVKSEASNGTKPYASDPELAKKIIELTDGVGADVSLEMAGFNSSLNNAIRATRRGGHVIFFGIKTGNFVLEDYNTLIVRGVTMHAVIGRELWRTWETTKTLFEDKSNGIQDKLYNVMLKSGEGTIVPIDDYNKEMFEQKMGEHLKLLIKFN